MEKKFFDVNLEIKNVSENEDMGIFEGYGSVFNIKDSYGDVVVKGAFEESLQKNGNPSMLWQHNTDMPIGVWTNAREDSAGLWLRGEINLNVQQGKEAFALIKQRAIKGLSIGFITQEEELDRTANTRMLKKVELMEVSLVTFPANKVAQVIGWKSELPSTEREFEKFLRSIGYGRTQSKAITSNGFKAFKDMQRDADDQEPIMVQRDADIEKLHEELNNLLSTLKERLDHVRGKQINS